MVRPVKSPYDISSYRPIALGSCVGKVMEWMILTRLEWFLGRCNLCSSIMSGYSIGRNSLDSVNELAISVEQQKVQRRIAAAIFVDIKGTFNIVAHDAIIHYLEDLGIGGRL